jgi:hypothetical protein
VICDLNLPVCGKCAKIGRHCDYGKVRLRWTDCVASRGRLAGQKMPVQIQRAPALQRNRDSYLLYFEKELLPRFNLSNTVPQLDLNILSRDPILLQSAIAVANAHQTYAYRNPDENASLARIRDRHYALQLFREHLSSANNDEFNKSLFIANVLLCILDGILEPSSQTSAIHHHLAGGKAILNHSGGVAGIFKSKAELPILMLSIFATMDLTHATLIGDEPYFEASSWMKLGGAKAWWGSVDPEDDFLETMAILSRLAALGHAVRHLNETIPIGTLVSIQGALDEQASRQINLSDSEKDPEKGSEKMGWAAFCSVYRYTASIYLYRALSGLDVGHALVQQAVSKCIEVIGGTALTVKLHHCILFPLLVVGTHCLSQGQQALVRQSILHTSTYLSFESLHSLTSFMESRWAKLDEDPQCVDITWWDYFDEIAAASCLF